MPPILPMKIMTPSPRTSIDICKLNEFLGHSPRLCEICQHRQAAVFMVVRREGRTAKAHSCLTCFELAEGNGFDLMVETVSLQEFEEIPA